MMIRFYQRFSPELRVLFWLFLCGLLLQGLTIAGRYSKAFGENLGTMLLLSAVLPTLLLLIGYLNLLGRLHLRERWVGCGMIVGSIVCGYGMLVLALAE